jgi:NlpC/P60 family putative phage cell wall peptidase
MKTGQVIVDAARGWIGTPYIHQTSCKGAGTDCLGLLRGVWREVLGPEPEAVPAYTADWSEASKQEVLWHTALKYLVAKALLDEAEGDVLLFRMQPDAVAKHCAFQSVTGSSRSFIHAYSGHSVVESPLSAPWQRKIVARFRFPEGA